MACTALWPSVALLLENEELHKDSLVCVDRVECALAHGIEMSTCLEEPELG